MNGVAYGALLVVHVLSAAVGLGAVATHRRVRRQGPPSGRPDTRDESLRRYFRGGRNWAELALALTPLLGLALLFGGDRGDAGEPWPWIGLACWFVAVSAESALCWPGERALAADLAAAASPGACPVDAASWRAIGRRVEIGSAVASLAVVAAFAVMFVQPK